MHNVSRGGATAPERVSSSKLVAHPNLRWHFYVAPEGWRASGAENLSQAHLFTTGPLTFLAEHFHSKELSKRFKVAEPVGGCQIVIGARLVGSW